MIYEMRQVQMIAKRVDDLFKETKLDIEVLEETEIVCDLMTNQQKFRSLMEFYVNNTERGHVCVMWIQSIEVLYEKIVEEGTISTKDLNELKEWIKNAKLSYNNLHKTLDIITRAVTSYHAE